jgi:hypothetical protein
MKPIFIKHRSGFWIARIYERQAEIFKTGYIFGYGHEFTDSDKQIKQWLVEAMIGEGMHKMATAEEFEAAQVSFVRHAFGLAHPDFIEPEAKEVCLRIIENEEEVRA